jgi:hypothetical protein
MDRVSYRERKARYSRLESPFKVTVLYEDYQAYEKNNRRIAKSQPEDYQAY